MKAPSPGREVSNADIVDLHSPLWSFGVPIRDAESIIRFEREKGIDLPAAYKALVMQEDGATCGQPYVRVVNTMTGFVEDAYFGSLIPFSDRGRDFSSVPNLNVPENEVIPRGLIAFGEEGGGYLWAFDYSDPTVGSEPPVVLINRDNTDGHYVLPVAPGFSAFLAMLSEQPKPTSASSV